MSYFRVTNKQEFLLDNIVEVFKEFNNLIDTQSLPTISSVLDLVTTNPDLYPIINLVGFYQKGDVTPSPFIYIASSTLVHDGGMVIHPSSVAPTNRSELNTFLSYSSSTPGRWVRMINPGDEIQIGWYGETNPLETDDSSIPITKAVQSPHTANRVIKLDSKLYTLYNTINFLNTNFYKTLRGNGDNTKIVCAKPLALSRLIYIPPRCHHINLEHFKIQAWNYPDEGESGWSSTYTYNDNGKYRFNDQVPTIAPVNGFEEDRLLDKSNPNLSTFVPSHTYNHDTIEMIVIGTVDRIQQPFSISIPNGQINDIITTITVSGTPDTYDTDMYAPMVRIVRQGSSVTTGFTNLPANSNALLPSDFSPRGATLNARCFVQYNYNKTFTITFKFSSAVDLSSLTVSQYYNPTTQTYTLPLMFDIYRRANYITIDSVTVNGLYFTGGDPIGYSNGLTVHAVQNCIIQNCTFRNIFSDGVSIKQQFDSWGPMIQANSLNKYITFRNNTFRNMSTSGIDFECDYAVVENNRFINIWGNGAIRLGSRAYGTIMEQNIVRNNYISFGTGLQSGQANIVWRGLGLSQMRQLIISECELVNAFAYTSTGQDINVSMSGRIDYINIDKCIFNNFWRAFQKSKYSNHLVVNSCVFRDVINGGLDKSIINITSGTVIDRLKFIDCTVERLDGRVINLIQGSISPYEYSPAVQVDNMILTATPLYNQVRITTKYYRQIWGSLHTLNANVNNVFECFRASALPPVTSHQMILVREDTNGSPQIIPAYSNGTNWVRIDNNAIIPTI